MTLQTGGSSLTGGDPVSGGYLVRDANSDDVGIGKLNHTFTVTRTGDYRFFFRYLDNHVTAPHPVDFAPSKLFDGPNLQSLKGTGIVTVTGTGTGSGTGSLVLDFSDVDNPTKTVLP